MRRKTLRFWTRLIILAAIVIVAGDWYWKEIDGESFLDAEIIAGLIGAAAATLATLFQRRAEFVASLRVEWAICLEAIAEVRTLYVREEPTEEHYLKAYSLVWASIDGMRSVYRDHGESRTHVGLYPFATLHDIRLVIEKDFARGEPPDREARGRRLEQIENCWRLFRYHFLEELETPEAASPILDRLKEDDRKFGVSLRARVFRRLPKRKLLVEMDLEIPGRPSASSNESHR